MLNKKIDNNTIEILWTGGWDSTYRLVELSKRPCNVQPIYVYGDDRPSEKYEKKTMEEIRFELNKRSETKATILPIKYIDKSSIPYNKEITRAYNFISKETQLGSQQEWLARLAYNQPGLEIGTESSPIEVSNILKAIHKYGNLVKNVKDDNYILDPDTSTNEGIMVFGNLVFPIVDKTGSDMKKNIFSWGYEDIMKKVWVCHTPLFGKPCGLCHPCELKIETNMEFLLTKAALKRYKKKDKQPFKFLYKIERKLFRTFDN